jgi:DNA-binding transcriptional ArsR family regulator
MSLESGESHPSRTVRRILDDPVAIRALAHPLRLKLRTLIGRQGPMTAAQAARELGISQALASHHLRQLAKYGFVEPAAGGNNRDRPWRITHTSMALPRGVPDEPTSVAGDLLEQVVAERAIEHLVDWHQHRDDYDPRWREHSGVGQSLVYVTVEEYAALHHALDALINPLVERRRLGDVAARPPDARPVDLTLISVPVPPTASGG